MTRVDEIDFEIIGEDLQAVIVTLDPGEAMVAEAGAFMYMDDGIEMATKTSFSDNKGMWGKLMEAGKRAITGESFFITMFANGAQQRRTVAFGAPYPGRVIPLELGDIGGTMICQKDCFLCGARGINVDIAFQRKIGVGLFGGEGFIMQKITSASGRGQVFLHAGGTILEKQLAPGEVLRVDTGCIVGMQPSVQYDIQTVPGIKNKLFGGEGLFFAVLRGPGHVWLQTLPFSRLADRVVSSAPSHGGSSRGEGSVLGGLGRLLDGN